MSFAKAKLLRFNEETTCAPPPGKYDPKFDSKIKGAVIEKSKRFVNPKIESAPSVCSFDSNSSCSFSNKPTFRTPQLPRKKITSTPRSAFEMGKCSSRALQFDVKSKKKLDDVFKCETQNNLVDQIDELTRVHTSQLIEKDQEISTLYNEISELKSSLVKAENSREIDYNNMKHKYDMEMDKIKTELEEAHALLEKERDEHEQIVKDLKNQVKMLDENLMNSSALNAELEFQLSEANLSLIEMKNYYGTLQEELKKTSENLKTIAEEKEAEIKAIKEQSNESLKNLTLSAEFNLETLSKKMEERITNLREQLEKLRIDEEEDFFEKINMISDEAQKKVEQFNERASEVFQSVKQMAETFDVKSKELIDSLSSGLKVNCEKLLEFAENAEDFEQEKVSNLENKIKIVDLEERVSILEEEVGKLRNQCRKYEIVHNETTKTIKVLSTRLFESESEVENMNEIKEELVLRKNALEEKISSLRNENEDLKEKISNLEVNIVKDVMDVEKNLLLQVENYKQCSNDETVKFKTEIDEQKKIIDTLLAEIVSYKHKISELNEHKLFYEEIGTKYKEEIESLSYKFKDLESRYNKNMTSQKNRNSELSRLLEEAKASGEKKEKQFVEEIDKLQEEKQNLKRDCEEKTDEVENLKIELAEVKTKLEKMENDIALMEDNGFEQEKQIEELAEQLDHYTQCGLKSANQIISLTKELEEKENEISRLQEAWTEKDLKIETLTAELNESKTYVQTMTEHVVALMSELAEKGKEIENLTNDNEIKNNTMIQVSEEYEKMKNLYQEEAKKCEDVEKELHDIQAENEKYVDEIISELVLEKERCSELAQSSEEASSSYRNSLVVIKGLEDKNQEITNQLREVEENLEAVEKELDDKIEENQVLSQKKDQMYEIVKSYKDQIYNLEEKLSSRNEELQNELDNLKQNEIVLNEQNFDLNNINNALEKKVKDKEAIIADLKETTSNLNEKLNELTLEKEDLVQMVKRQWEEMELLTNEISNQQEEIDDLKQAKEDKLDEVRALHQAELQNQIFALQQSLEDTQKVVIELKTKEEDLVFKLKSAEADLTQAETEKEEYEKNLDDLKCQVADIESKFLAMEKRKNEYKLYAVEMENENERMKQEIQFLSEEKENMQENKHEVSLVSLNEQVADLASRNRDLESIIGPFREQLVQFEKERAELLSRSENTEKELKALALEHAKSLGHQNHKQKIRHVVHLTETISDLKKEMEKLRTENNKLRATILEQQESTFKKSCNAAKGKKDKENTVEAVPLVKHKNERQSSPANPLKQRNIT